MAVKTVSIVYAFHKEHASAPAQSDKQAEI